MTHPLVELAKEKYFHKSHINEPLVTGKARTDEERIFNEQADKFFVI